MCSTRVWKRYLNKPESMPSRFRTEGPNGPITVTFSPARPLTQVGSISSISRFASVSWVTSSLEVIHLDVTSASRRLPVCKRCWRHFPGKLVTQQRGERRRRREFSSIFNDLPNAEAETLARINVFRNIVVAKAGTQVYSPARASHPPLEVVLCRLVSLVGCRAAPSPSSSQVCWFPSFLSVPLSPMSRTTITNL